MCKMLLHDSSSACNYSKNQVLVAKAILEMDDPESILSRLDLIRFGKNLSYFNFIYYYYYFILF